MTYKVEKNLQYGFKSIAPMPTAEELSIFYNSNYYDAKGYSVKYTDDEMTHKNIVATEIEFFLKQKVGSILDIGCGEGFVMNHFDKKGWDVTGLDFSHDGISRHFPHLTGKVIKGDVFKSLDKLMEGNAKFDLIVCNNVLEHVVDPLAFLSKFKILCGPNTLIRIQVPNDFSWFQESLIANGKVSKQYWVAPPGHLCYFNKDNLQQVLHAFDYEVVELLGDFPIELFLLNEQSNYSQKPEVGPLAHSARVSFEVSLFNSSVQNYISFRRGCGHSGTCRNLIAYCKIN